MTVVGDARLVLRMRRAGIVNPIWTLRAARETHLPLDLACAILDQESGGGHNEWGHDPTIFVGGYDDLNKRAWGERVSERAYLEYRRQRVVTGRCQGVGPCQLTYYAFQDQADKLGGCWKPLHNMRVGFGVLADNIRRSGLHAGVAAYNGSGLAALRYADSVLAKRLAWRKRLYG